MTVLEGNQAYRAAMKILMDARKEACQENNDVVHLLLIRDTDRLTEQETRDMEASFQSGGAQ